MSLSVDSRALPRKLVLVALSVLVAGILLAQIAGSAAASGPDGTIKGYVTDALTSNPVGGAFVRIQSEYGLPFVYETFADINGYFELSVTPHEYMVIVLHPDYYTYQATVGVGSAKTIWVNASLLSAAPRDAIVKGNVTDASTGTPITWGRVVAQPSGPGPSLYINVSYIDPSGFYEIWLPAGDYNMFTDSVVGYYGWGSPVSLAPGQVEWLDIMLSPNPVDSNVTGTVRDAVTSLPLAGATVSLEYVDDGLLLPSVTTNASGGYVIPASSGGAIITANMLGYAPYTTFWFIPAMTNETVDFYLWPINAWIQGYVSDFDTGLPIPNATASARDFFNGFYDEAMTDASGYYQIPVAQGFYDVQYSADGYFPNSWSFPVGDGETFWANVSLVPLPPIVATVQGYIIDASDGSHVPGMTVAAFDTFSGFSNVTVSDGTGFYSMGFIESPFLIGLVPASPGYAGGSALGSTSPGDILWLNITIYPLNATVRFVVTDALTGLPISGASAQVSWGFTYFASDTTDGSGIAAVPSPATTDVSVNVWATDYYGYYDVIAVAPGLNTLNIALWPFLPFDVNIQGYITDNATSSPIPGAMVQVSGYDDVSVTNWTDPAGYYSLWIVAYPQEVRATAFGYSANTTMISPSPGESLWVNMSLDSDPFPPEILSFTATPNAGVSPINPTSLVADIMEKSLESATMYRLRLMSSSGDIGTFLPIGQVDSADLTISQTGVDLWSVATTWNARESGGWIGNASGTEWWPAQTAFLPGSYGVSGQWQNATATDGGFAVFDATTGDLLMVFRFSYGFLSPGDDPNSTFTPGSPSLLINVTSSQILGSTWAGGITRELAGLRFTYDDIVPTGTYGAFLQITDAAGNYNASAVVFDVDNGSPTADAGADQTVDEDTGVTFDGSGSTDDVGIASYTWTFVDGTPQTLTGISPSYTFATPGVFVVTLTVVDAAGHSSSDTMTVTVRDVTAPTANAGPDQTVDEDTVVTFDGSASSDNVAIVTYTWTFVDGVPQTLTGVSPTYVFPNPGIYVVTLTVEDAAGFSASDTMVVTVTDTTPPTASAGPDQTVDEDTTVAFNGGSSTDNVGVANYTWTFVDVSPRTLYGSSPTYVFASPGSYTVLLTVRDAAGNTGTDTMTVTVRDVTAPTANAGPDQTVDEDTVVTFDGGASSDNVGVTNYTWTFIDGVARTRYGTSPTYTFATPGTYVVTLTVRDTAGNSASDAMTVTVRDVTAPTANAGPDQTVDEDTVVTFDGGASSDNVGVTNYTWTFTDGTARTLYGVAPTYTFATPGSYAVTLTARDAAGRTASDTILVTVLDVTDPAVSIDVPSAGASVSGTITVTTTVSDNVGVARVELRVDGTLVATDPASPFEFGLNTANYSNGSHTIRITAYDAAGNSASDEVTVTVSNAPPGGGLGDLALYGGLAAIILVAAIVVALLLLRRRKKPTMAEAPQGLPPELEQTEESQQGATEELGDL